MKFCQNVSCKSTRSLDSWICELNTVKYSLHWCAAEQDCSRLGADIWGASMLCIFQVYTANCCFCWEAHIPAESHHILPVRLLLLSYVVFCLLSYFVSVLRHQIHCWIPQCPLLRIHIYQYPVLHCPACSVLSCIFSGNSGPYADFTGQMVILMPNQQC